MMCSRERAVTGNVCDRETLDYLRSVAPDVRAVRGDWDEASYCSFCKQTRADNMHRTQVGLNR